MSLEALFFVANLPFEELKKEDAPSPLAHALLLLIAYRAQKKDKHQCVLSIDKLAARFGCTSRSVYNAVTELQDGKYIRVERGEYGNGTRVFSFPQLTAEIEAGFKITAKSKPDNLKPASISVPNSGEILKPDDAHIEAGFKMHYIDQSSSKKDDDLDDDAASLPFLGELRKIAERHELTVGESEAIGAYNATTEYGREVLRRGLGRLRKAWPGVDTKHDCASYLKRVFESVEADMETERRKVTRRGYSSGEAKSSSYSRHEDDTLTDYLRDDVDFTENGIDSSAPGVSSKEEIRASVTAFVDERKPMPKTGAQQTAGIQSSDKQKEVHPESCAYGEVWKKFMTLLGENYAGPTFESHLRRLTCKSIDEERVVIEASNQHSHEFLSGRFITQLERTAKSIPGGPSRVSVEYDPTLHPMH